MSEFIDKDMEKYQYLLNHSKFEFKQHQYDGVKWCVKNEKTPNPFLNISGGIIADEMGLGKTILMIGTMFVNFVRKSLIIVPPVLIQQWVKEFYKVSGHIPLVFYGQSKKQISLETIQKSPIIITTYNTLMNEKCILRNVIWQRVVFDEAHHLRNKKTKKHIAALNLKSRIRWFVTGTPIQNKMNDLYSLCSLIGMERKFYRTPSNLSIVKSFILRRTKEQVGIKLPSLCKTNCVVDWQNKKEMILSEGIHSLVPNTTHVIAHNNKFKEAFGSTSGALVALMRAKQSCILPQLLKKSIEEYIEEGFVKPEALEAINYTSKIDAVINKIETRKSNGRGKIVFCHFQSEIDIIAERLTNIGLSHVKKYDGRNSGGKNLEKLSDAADALVIQIQTGCEGLNLQGNYSEIYFVSPHWNPSIEDQAIARCHRIGQTNPVDVFKFEMKGFKKQNDEQIDPIALEKYVNTIQNIKRNISVSVLDNSSE